MRKRFFELPGGDFADVLVGGLKGGIVDEDVEAAKLGNRPPDDFQAMSLVGDIARNGDGFAPGITYQSGGLLRVVFLVEIGDQHVRAFSRKGQGDGAPDAAVAARDDDRAPGQFPAASVGDFAMIGLVLQLRFAGRARPGWTFPLLRCRER